MQITEKQLNDYRSQLAELETAAGEFITEYLQAFRVAFPRASVADIREAAKEAIEDVLNAFGTEAGVLSNELFDKVCKAEGINATAELYDAIDRDLLDGKVRYFARDLVKGNSPVFTRNVTDLSRFYVKRNAYENMVRNCEKNNVMYARVPAGGETCRFCIMLASRGFAYHNEHTAKGKHGVHAHCRCMIVPGVEGKTKIAGYDPAAYYRVWKRIEDVEVISKTLYSETKKRLQDQEATIQDNLKNLWSQYKRATASAKSFQEIYAAYITSFSSVGKIAIQDFTKIEGKELQVVAWLSRIGKNILFRNPNKSLAEEQNSSDILVNGVLHEIKRVTSPHPSKITKRIFEKINNQGPRFIIDLSCSDMDFKDAALRIAWALEDERVEEVLLIHKGTLRRYKK